jgi:hypothetical protein
MPCVAGFDADNKVLKLSSGTAEAIALPLPPFEGADRPQLLALDWTGAEYVADSSRVFMPGSGAADAETLPITGLSDIKGPTALRPQPRSDCPLRR